jgi:hypothetical protein
LRNWIYISHINLNVYILALIKTPLKEKKNYNLVLAISCQSFLPPAVGATTRHSRHTKRWREDTQHLQLEANLQPDEETSQIFVATESSTLNTLTSPGDKESAPQEPLATPVYQTTTQPERELNHQNRWKTKANPISWHVGRHT